MMKSGFCYILLFLLTLLPATTVLSQTDEAAIAEVLDSFHEAAADGDWEVYFDLMADQAVFLGTDVGERWPKAEFQAYAAGRSGWTYYPRQRNIDLTPDGNSAWFDEVLESVSYGTSRGSGVLVKTAEGWKIAQYHLTFPIPNALSRELTDRIKAWEAGANQSR
jgi:ketosteroid isomerase-like protein